MVKYKNLGGDSGIVAYESGNNYIKVLFSDSMLYTYTNASSGVRDVELMKRYAERGEGLNSHISRVVKKRFARKRPYFGKS